MGVVLLDIMYAQTYIKMIFRGPDALVDSSKFLQVVYLAWVCSYLLFLSPSDASFNDGLPCPSLVLTLGWALVTFVWSSLALESL